MRSSFIFKSVTLSLGTVFSGLCFASGASNPAPSPSKEALAAAAAASVAQKSSLCTPIKNFYWEIGTANGIKASGVIGSNIKANTEVLIASASKMIFGAYVLEKKKGVLSANDISLLRLTSGYSDFNPTLCALSLSVSACFANAKYNAVDNGKFFYGGGHFQKLAMDLGLGSMNKTQLAAELQKYIGTDVALKFSSPSPAGGMNMSSAAYAKFLQKMLQNKYVLSSRLGESAICTYPGACPGSNYSPTNYRWSYSWGHWIESGEPDSDGAFSSTGAYGFYPWINAQKTHYGIVAREYISANSAMESAKCGQEIRKAYFEKLLAN